MIFVGAIGAIIGAIMIIVGLLTKYLVLTYVGIAIAGLAVVALVINYFYYRRREKVAASWREIYATTQKQGD